MKKYLIMFFVLVLTLLFSGVLKAFFSSHHNTIKIITWNIDCLSGNFKERYENITKIIHKEDPDIITLQESNAFFFKELKNNYNSYFKSDFCGALTTMSKYPIVQQNCYIGKTLQCRPVLIVDILINQSIVKIINVHLDSSSYYKRMRISQMKYINTKIDSTNTIYLGDFNFSDELEATTIHRSLTDSWLMFAPNENGYTWDMDNNPMAKKNAFGNDTNSRLDRIYLSQAFQIKNMYLIGKEKIRDQMWPSDHYGVVIEVDLVN